MRLTHCGNCGRQLTGKQVLWCSPTCANTAWQRDHAEERASALRQFRANDQSKAARLQRRIAKTEALLRDLKTELASLDVEPTTKEPTNG